VAWSQCGGIDDGHGNLTAAKPAAHLRKELYKLAQAIGEGLISSDAHEVLRSGNGALGDHGSISGELIVDAGSIDTKNKRRDKHMRSAEFFDVSRYPTLTFTAFEVAPAADGTLKINGALRIRDQSQPVELIAVPTNPSPDRVTLNAEGTLDRSNWGMSWRKGASMVNRVAVKAQFVRA
jgi:YceI-like domain